jgi:hypothetical protein
MEILFHADVLTARGGSAQSRRSGCYVNGNRKSGEPRNIRIPQGGFKKIRSIQNTRFPGSNDLYSVRNAIIRGRQTDYDLLQPYSTNQVSPSASRSSSDPFPERSMTALT